MPSGSSCEQWKAWGRTNRWILGAAGVVVAAALVGYGNSFSGPLVFDDLTSILYNPSIRHLWPVWETLFPSHQSVTSVVGRPLINLSLAMNYAVGGMTVQGYHVVNLLIHVLAGITLLGVARRTFLQPTLRDRFGGAALSLALVIAILWTVHPLQTESVTYITQRCESMMGLFYLLTLYAFIRATETKSDARWLWISVAASLLGTASKEVMISAPLIVLLYDRTFVAGTFGKALTERKAYYAGLACSWLFLGWMMARAGTRAETVGYVPGLPMPVYVLNEVHAVAHYLRLAIWPWPQVFDYGPPEISSVGQVWFDALVILLLGAATLLALRRVPTAVNPWPVLGFLGCWFFLILAPTSSFIPIKDVMAEHRVYLSLAAVIALGVTTLYAWSGKRALWIVFFLVLPVYLTLTIMRNEVYRSALALWTDTVEKRPLNPRAHNNLANALVGKGDMEAAVSQYREVIRLDPKDSQAHRNLGGVLVQMGRMPEARVEYEIALQIDPNNYAVHTNQGVMLMQMGQTTEAIKEFEEALKKNPRDAEAHNNLGAALAGLGRMDEAIRQYEEAVEINPDYADAHGNLGAALGQMGKLTEAIKEYEEVLRINPRDATAYYGLGVALTGLGRISEAIQQYEEALKIDPHYERARSNLMWLRTRKGER